MRPERPIHVFINKQKVELSSPTQTGASLKALAGIPLADVLFLQQPGDDLVVANDTAVMLKSGDHLHSQPPADYGAAATQGGVALDPLAESDLFLELLRDTGLEAARATIHPEPGGWNLLVLTDYRLPRDYTPDRVRLLVKLPPAFPDAAPDMFWVSPAVRAPDGCLPRATTLEILLGEEWQRFSWHLKEGAWTPGVSTLRDFLRCVAARFQQLD